MMKKIVIVNPFGIGDFIFSTPLIEILKKSFPDLFLGYVCNRRVSELIATNPHLDKIFIYEKDEYRNAWRRSKTEWLRKISALLGSIRKERFDIAMDLSLNYQNSMLLKLLGVRRRIGLNYRNRNKFLTDRIDIEGFSDKHVIDYYLDVLKPLNIDVKRYEIIPRVYAADSDLEFADRLLSERGLVGGDIVIGMVPGCGESWGADAKYRRWDSENFARLADMLIEKYDAKIILLGNAHERDICSSIEKVMKNSVINYCGETSLGQFLGILKMCQLVITNDGGPLHMAIGLGVKTVSVFGPVDETVYGPYNDVSDHAVLSRKDLSCRPCYRKFKYKKCENRICLDSITVEEALTASEQMICR